MLRFLVISLLLVGFSSLTPGSASAQSLTMKQYEKNMDGLSLLEALGNTLVGSTRSSGKTWSVYLNWNGNASFQFSTGKKMTGTWKKKSKNIICFKGLVDNKPWEEVCKLAAPRGRGLDWRTVKLNGTKDGILRYSYADAKEKSGSSQIAFLLPGGQYASRYSRTEKPSNWVGRVVAGRTIGSKSIWFLDLKKNKSYELITTSGYRYKGTYSMFGNTLCLKRVGKNSECVKTDKSNTSGRVYYTPRGHGLSTSEIVYVSPSYVANEKPKPNPDALVRKAPIAKSAGVRHYHVIETDRSARYALLMGENGELSLIDPVANAGLAGVTLMKFGGIAQSGASNFPKIRDIALAADALRFAFLAGDALAVVDFSSKASLQIDMPLATSEPGKDAAGAAPSLKGNQILDVAISPDGELVAIGTAGQGVRTYLASDLSPLWAGPQTEARDQLVRFTPDGRHLLAVTRAGTIRLYDVKTGQVVSSLVLKNAETGLVGGLYLSPSSVVFGRRGTIAIAGFNGDVVGLSLNSGILRQTFHKPHKNRKIRDITYSPYPGADRAVMASKGGLLREIDITNGKLTRFFGGASMGMSEVNSIGNEFGAFIAAHGLEGSPGYAFWAIDVKAKKALALEKSQRISGVELRRQIVTKNLTRAIAAHNERVEAGRAAYAEGRCDVLGAMGDWFQLDAARQLSRNKKAPLSCEENLEKKKTDAVAEEFFAALLHGDCRTVRRLKVELPEDMMRERKGLTLEETCDSVAKLRDMIGVLDRSYEDANCERLDAPLRDALAIKAQLDDRREDDPRAAQAHDGLMQLCRERYIMTHASAREAYFAGIKAESDGDIQQAKDIYETVMQNHSDDPMADKAADRLLELVDKGDVKNKSKRWTHPGLRALETGGFLAFFQLPE